MLISDLYLGVGVLFLFIILFQYWYYTNSINPKKQFIDDIKQIDQNGDGVISRKELKYYLTRLEEHKSSISMTWKDFGLSMCGGFISGCLIGLIQGNIHHGLAMGIMLGLVNPISVSITRRLF
jgi:hypothetical protein